MSEKHEPVMCHGLYDDGNVFAIMGKARRCLRAAGRDDDGRAMFDRVIESGSYSQAVSIISEYAVDSDEFLDEHWGERYTDTDEGPFDDGD